MFKTNLQKKQKVTILLVVFLLLFMIFTLVLARYISQRTDQKDTSAAESCKNGLCGTLSSPLSADQSHGLSYDLNLSTTVNSGVTLSSIDFQTCLNPGTNASHKKVYEKLGPGIWKSIEETNGVPNTVCYRIGERIPITSINILDTEVETQNPNNKTFTRVFGGANAKNSKVSGSLSGQALTLQEISDFIQSDSTIDKSAKYTIKAVIKGNSDTLVNDQIVGNPISFGPLPTSTPPEVGTIFIPNGGFEKKTGSINEGGIPDWHFSTDLDTDGTRVHDCNLYQGSCKEGNNFVTIVRGKTSDGKMISNAKAHFATDWLDTGENLSGRTVRISFYVKSHNMDNPKLKGLFVQRKHPDTGSDWLEEIHMPESTLTNVWAKRTYDLTFPESNTISTTSFRIVLKPELEKDYQLAYYYDDIQAILLSKSNPSTTPSATPTPTATHTPVPGDPTFTPTATPTPTPTPTVPTSCLNGICGKLTPSLSEDQSKGLSYDLKLSDIVLPNTTFISGKIDFQTCLTPGTNTKHINLYNYLGKGRHESTEVGNGNYPKWVCYNIGDTISITSLPLPDGKIYTRILGGTEEFKVLGKDTAHDFANISTFIKENPDIDNDLKYSVKVVIRGNKINNGGEVANDQIYGTPIKFVLPIATDIPTPTPTGILTPEALTCSIEYDLAGGGKVQTNVSYIVKLNKEVSSSDGVVVIRDDFKDSFEITNKPNYCQVKTRQVQSAVLGISDQYTERGSVLVSIIFFSALAGGVVYLIVLKNRESIGWKLVQKKPYLAALLASGVVLAIGSVYFLVQQEVSPTDSSAKTYPTTRYLECKPPAGTQNIVYTMKIKGSGKAKNDVEVQTGTNPSIQTCSTEFTIVQVGETITPSDTATPTPTDDPTATATPTPTITPIVDSPPPSDKPTQTPEPSHTPIPSEEEPTAIVTEPPVGLICGKADINNNGRFDIYDFGGYQVGFASYYQKTCDDTEEMRQTYSPCGGKDVVPDEDGAFGKIDIFDFVSFAQRYSKPTCDL